MTNKLLSWVLVLSLIGLVGIFSESYAGPVKNKFLNGASISSTLTEPETAVIEPIPTSRIPTPRTPPTNTKAISTATAFTTRGLSVVDLTEGIINETDLAQALVANLPGVTISNVTYTGDNQSAGTFTGGGTNPNTEVGIESGVVLGSGKVKDVVGPNDFDATSTPWYLPGDDDLAAIPNPENPWTTYDAAVLEFDFTANADINIISFRYVFSSDEYNEWVGQFNDLFGCFVNGVNRALLPDGLTYIGVATINNSINPEFYRNNDPSDLGIPTPINCEMDGLTTVLTLQTPINPAPQINHIKIVIADVNDHYLDANVFIEPFEGLSVWYVDDSQDNPPGDGRTWNTAFKYLQDALNNPALIAGDEIWVGQGTYKPDQGNGIIPGNRNATFQLINGVTIKGGYAGIGALNPYARDIKTYETILSGDLNGNDGPNFTYYSDNSYHVVKGADNAILDGFIIERGYGKNTVASGEPWWTITGSGMLNGFCSPVVKNCTFRYNNADSYGGAIANISSSPEITNCTFIGNRVKSQPQPPYPHPYKELSRVDRNGSAIYSSYNSQPPPPQPPLYPPGCWVRGRGGSAIYSYNSQPQVKNCIFIDNYSYFMGGAISAQHSQSEITNCIFSNNTDCHGGGAIANVESSSMTVTNCVFAGNTSIGNNGGGLSNWSSEVVVTNCTFTQNHAGYMGGGVFNLGDENSSATLINCIIWDNTDDYPGNDEVKSAYNTNPVNISYCDIKGSSNSWGDAYFGINGGGNIDSDPLFVDRLNPAGPDGIFRTSDDGLRLSLGSPCINAANHLAAPPTDILGTGRFGIADIGAYEFKFNLWTILGGFNYPSGIYYDNDSGYIYVANSGNSRIVKTKIDGTGWTTLEGFDPHGISYDSATGYIYVTDTYNSRIVKTKIEGTDQTFLEGFSDPCGIYYDNTSEYIYVADTYNSRIVKTKIDGTGWTILGGFSFPSGIYYDNDLGYIYVADSGNGRIVKTKIDGTGWTTYGTFGYGVGEFFWPCGIYYDNDLGYIYVADTENHRIVKTKIDGTGWATYYGAGGLGRLFTRPCGIYYDLGYIYVADSGGNDGRIVRTFPPW